MIHIYNATKNNVSFCLRMSYFFVCYIRTFPEIHSGMATVTLNNCKSRDQWHTFSVPYLIVCGIIMSYYFFKLHYYNWNFFNFWNIRSCNIQDIWHSYREISCQCLYPFFKFFKIRYCHLNKLIMTHHSNRDDVIRNIRRATNVQMCFFPQWPYHCITQEM